MLVYVLQLTMSINDLTITALVHRQYSLSIQSSEAVDELKLLHTWGQAVNWEIKKCKIHGITN